MIHQSVASDSPSTANGQNGDPCADPLESRTESLEQRVRRLEEAVAVLQDTRHLEERVVERVTSRVSRTAAQANQNAGPTIIDTGRKLLPAAFTVVQAGTNEAERHAQQSPSDAGRPWLIFDVYAEARMMVQMFLDRRYRMTWQGKVIPATLLAAILLSWIWLPGTSLLPSSLMTLVDKIIDLVLAFFAFKVLSREVRRYREVVADLPPLHHF